MFLRCFSFFLIKKKRKKAILSKSNKFETRIDFCFFHKIQIEKNTGPEERERNCEIKRRKKKPKQILAGSKERAFEFDFLKKKLFERKSEKFAKNILRKRKG